MILCNKEKLELKGDKATLLTEATLIFSNLIRAGAISEAEELLILFEAVAKELRNEFEEGEE